MKYYCITYDNPTYYILLYIYIYIYINCHNNNLYSTQQKYNVRFYY